MKGNGSINWLHGKENDFTKDNSFLLAWKVLTYSFVMAFLLETMVASNCTGFFRDFIEQFHTCFFLVFLVFEVFPNSAHSQYIPSFTLRLSGFLFTISAFNWPFSLGCGVHRLSWTSVRPWGSSWATWEPSKHSDYCPKTKANPEVACWPKQWDTVSALK